MIIADKRINKEQCNHKLGSIYVDPDDLDTFYMVIIVDGVEDDHAVEKFAYLNLDDSSCFWSDKYDSLEEMDIKNPDDIEVKAVLVIE